MVNPQAAHGLVPVSHHMFYLVDAGRQPVPPFVPRNGLVVVQPGAAVIFTGIHTGVAELAVEIHREPPGSDTADWDDVVEVSLQATAGRLRVSAVMSHVPELPVLTPTGPGDYRLRIHARGRDTSPDGVAAEPVESYLIAIWPAPFAAEHVYKLTDSYGGMLRESAADAPPPPTQPRPDAPTEQRRHTERGNLLRARRLRDR